ncbi:MAG: MotA/TolQ/ExbB proton channel family protein [Myxococcota bacterium]
MTFEWTEIWAHMGLVARAVLFTLVFMSIWSAVIVVERMWRLRSVARTSTEFSLKAQQWLRERRFPQLLQAEQEYARSPLFTVVGGAVREYLEGLEAQAVGDSYDVIEAAQRSVERNIELEVNRLRKGLGGLASISSSAPFVGLFGTTFGIINSFRAIGVSGQGDLATVAPGIAEALITTAVGIFVALPAVWFFNYLMGRVDGLGADLRHAGSEVVDFLIKDIGRHQRRPFSTAQAERAAA